MSNNYTGQAAFGLGSTNTDGVRVSKTGAQVVTQLHGQYTEQMLRGNLFMATTVVTGIALITTAATGNHPTIWNPANSGVNVSLVHLALMGIAAGTHAPTGIGWYKTASAGSSVATGAPIATFTEVAPINCLIGGSQTSMVKWAPATCTFTAAPAFLCGVDLTLATYVVTAVVPPWTAEKNYDGKMGIAPGNALSLCSTAATTTALLVVKLVWEEIPV